jgi:hypothetical protein
MQTAAADPAAPCFGPLNGNGPGRSRLLLVGRLGIIAPFALKRELCGDVQPSAQAPRFPAQRSSLRCLFPGYTRRGHSPSALAAGLAAGLTCKVHDKAAARNRTGRWLRRHCTSQARLKQQSGYDALVEDAPCPEQAPELFKYSIGSPPAGVAVPSNALGRAGKGHSMRRAAASAAPVRQRYGAGALRSVRVLPARLSS